MKNKLKKEEKRLMRFVFGLFIRFVVHMAYIAGLTMIVPILFLVAFPTGISGFEILEIGEKLQSSMVIAVGMIVISTFLMRWYYESWGKAFKCLGRMTFIPAVIALIFAVFGKGAVIAWAGKSIHGFAAVEPLITEWLDRFVPRIWILTIGYFLVGIILLLWGMRIEERKKRKGFAEAILGRRIFLGKRI